MKGNMWIMKRSGIDGSGGGTAPRALPSVQDIYNKLLKLRVKH
jgi:hypothetical protein